MRTRPCYILLCLLALALPLAAGCSRSAPPDPVTPVAIAPEATPPPPAATSAPSPTVEIPIPHPRDEGLGSAGGILYTIYGQAPIPGTVFYLTLAVGENQDRPPVMLTGAHAEAGDVRGTSGERGEIALDAIPPGRYFFVVWAPYNWIIAVESETNEAPRLIEVEAGQRLDLGRVDVPWP